MRYELIRLDEWGSGRIFKVTKSIKIVQDGEVDSVFLFKFINNGS